MRGIGIPSLIAAIVGLVLVAAPVANAAAMSGMNIQMSAGMDMPMPEDCDACGEAGLMAASGCFAYCAAPGAILPPAQPPAEAGGLYHALLADDAVADRHRLPDPHPPKSIAMM